MEYRVVVEFEAQSKSVLALMKMYSLYKRDGVGDAVPATAIVVFSAFAIESYLNSLGARNVPFWDEIERLPWKSKVNILHSVAQRDPDWGAQHLQFATDVFRLRDRLAHGKPDRVVGTAMPEGVDPMQVLMDSDYQPDWYRSITREWVLNAEGRFEGLMNYLAELFHLPKQDHTRMSSGYVQVTDDHGTVTRWTGSK